MDKRAAGQYLDTLFGTTKGYVAVAYKDKGESWQESTFAWPQDRPKLIGWASVHADANIFICPGLRSSPIRQKGDGRALKWLWADVDWDGVPHDKRDVVEARIKELGTLVVASGSGQNKHVYVRLDRELEVAEHLRLNTGLRDYLYADNKQTDNSLLRLPGTTNWKTTEGSPVKRIGGVVRGKDVSPEALLAKRVFANARIIGEVTGDFSWEVREVEGLPRRMRRLIGMESDEAIARYGSRHKAVWAVTGELHKRGLDGDEIHTLMDTFPPALEKAAEENGYDVHKDVEKRLIWDRANMPVLTDEEMSDAEEEGFEDADDADDLEQFKRDVDAKADAIYLRRMAERRAREMEADSSWTEPPPSVSWSLTDVLEAPPEPARYLIGAPPNGKRGLAGEKHNVIITAQFKTGKTKFVVATIAKALCDGTDFMGSVPVHTKGLVVGHWNCEMDPDEMASDYVIPAGIEATDRFHVANLRGYRVNLLTAKGRQWAINWLKERNVKVWTIDSLARLARMTGVSEKDNDEMFDLLMAIDEIKVEAGVDVIFLITHTGRAVMEEGKERARGATAIDDWCDARWIMTEADGVRFLAVDGRGVGMDATALVYDDVTGHSELGIGSKAEVKADGEAQAVVRVVKEFPGLSKAGIAKAMKRSQRLVGQYLEEAVEAGFIEVRRESSGSRGRPGEKYFLTGGERPEGDRRRRATPREVDLRDLGKGRGRRIK